MPLDRSQFRPRASRAGRAFRSGALSCLILLALGVGCGTQRPVFQEPAQPKFTLTRLPPGPIGITVISQNPNISIDPPNDRIESTGEGAATATRTVLNTPDLGNGQLETAVGLVQFAAAPFAAVYGAIRAHQHRLSIKEQQAAAANLMHLMTIDANAELLRDQVAEAARQRTRRQLFCLGQGGVTLTNPIPASAVLELALERFELKTNVGAPKEYTLRVVAGARLRRCSDDQVLVNRRYHFQSGPALFIDWISEVGLASVVQTAYKDLAEQVADDFFRPISEPPLLIGPGQEHSSVRSPAHEVREAFGVLGIPALSTAVEYTALQTLRDSVASARSRSGRPIPAMARQDRVRARRVRLVRGTSLERRRLWARETTNRLERASGAVVAPTNPVPRETVSIAVFTGQPDERLHSQSVPPEPGSSPGDMTETEWKMDGLENDRNAVVQAAACLAAVPLGLWEQTVGAIGRRSREQAIDLTRRLNEIPEQTHFDGQVADRVGRRLSAQVLNQVERTDEPLRIALTDADHSGEAENAKPPPTRRDSGLALEIQIVNAGLVPERGRSRKSLALSVEALATVIRSTDGQELYSRPIRYRSTAKRLKDWAAADASAFRQELDACSETTAAALTSDLISRGFLVPGPQGKEAH